MGLAQTTRGIWKDTPATGAGGSALNDNFNLLDIIYQILTPADSPIFSAINSFIFQNPIANPGDPTFKVIQNANGSHFFECYANDGITLLIRLASDGSVISDQTVTRVLWIDYARKYTHAVLPEATPVVWDLSESDWASLTLTADRTLTFTNLKPGHYTLRIIMGGYGSNNLIWPSEIHWPDNIPPVPTPDVGAVDVVKFFSPNGTDFYAV